MGRSLRQLVSCRRVQLLAFLALAIASFSFLPFPLFFHLLSSFLTSSLVFVFSNFIVLAILVSSGSLQPYTSLSSRKLSPPTTTPLSGMGSSFNQPPMVIDSPNDLLSKPKPIASGRMFVNLAPVSSQRRVHDHGHLHLVKHVPLVTADDSANMQRPKAAFVACAATGPRIVVGRTSDNYIRPVSAASDLRPRTVQKIKTMSSVSVVVKQGGCDSPMDVMDRLLNTNARLSPDDFNKKCENFIAKVHLSRTNRI